MVREPGIRLSVWLAIGVVVLAGGWAQGRETEGQLLQRIQNEHNPVRKAKEEIKLANLRFMQVHDAYSRGQIEAGVKLLGAFVETLKTSWKTLQSSGRKASKQPDGFRELEISLRENVRSLQELGRDVSYFDRAPLLNAAQELEQTRAEVLHELFPGENPRTGKGSAAPPPTPSLGSPPESR